MINEFEQEEQVAQRRKEDRAKNEMNDLMARIEDIQARTEEYLAPLAPLTPSSDLEDVKRLLNAILSYAKGDF